ncbi:proton pump-interactor 1-like isoform X2 [Amaranthus tricolor]|nr:proton pump-interactor 1-like isoform X2 [Amaranthus tricolor]
MPKMNGEVKSKLQEEEVGMNNVSEAITFGSHGVDEVETKGEEDNVSNANIAKDNAGWAEMQCHYFWFVKRRPLEDASLKEKIDYTEKEIQKYQLQISRLYEDIKAKSSEKNELYEEINVLSDENQQYRAFITEKRKEMKPLQSALGTLRGGGGEKGFSICSSEAELNQIIRSLEYQIQHESMSLKEEKQILREIKEWEATRPKVIANSAERAKIQEALGQKEAILDQVKLLGTDVDGVRKQQAAVKAKKDSLGPQLDAVKLQLGALRKDLDIVKKKKAAAVQTMKELREQRDKGNAPFYNEYRPMLTNAKDIAVKKDVKALEELCSTEVEKFMSQWNRSKAFRDDYEKRILKSLDYRQMSRDGRIRNFDEKPLVTDSPRPEPVVAAKAMPKQQKEVENTTSTAEKLPAGKVQKESKKGNKELKSASEQVVEEEEIFMVEKPKKDVRKNDERDVREMKEEEKEKQRQALERKKKLQEKAAAKAAARAQKEAEKKQKEREKKLRKKEASTSQPNIEEEQTEKSEPDEPENSESLDEAIETPAPSKAKVQPSSLRHRKPIKTRGAPPKAILKKKKSDKYLVWGSIAAATVVGFMLLLVGYKYFL